MSIANRPNLAPVSTGGLLLYDPYGCCLLVSDDIPALLGVARGDFIEQKLFDLPLWREIGVTALLERAVRGEFPLQQEIKWQRSGSDLLCFVLHVTQIRIDSLPHLQLQIQEIHEQQDASNEYQATLLQSISDAVIGLDLNLRITEWNRAAASLYGWQAEEVL
ncbi:MAG: PAS domain-containing protein, partial [Caldilineaceae bacterium]|nr:PAS domain-containing protein [Caldilineaceae bacterium]